MLRGTNPTVSMTEGRRFFRLKTNAGSDQPEQMDSIPTVGIAIDVGGLGLTVRQLMLETIHPGPIPRLTTIPTVKLTSEDPSQTCSILGHTKRDRQTSYRPSV